MFTTTVVEPPTFRWCGVNTTIRLLLLSFYHLHYFGALVAWVQHSVLFIPHLAVNDNLNTNASHLVMRMILNKAAPFRFTDEAPGESGSWNMIYDDPHIYIRSKVSK